MSSRRGLHGQAIVCGVTPANRKTRRIATGDPSYFALIKALPFVRVT